MPYTQEAVVERTNAHGEPYASAIPVEVNKKILAHIKGLLDEGVFTPEEAEAKIQEQHAKIDSTEELTPTIATLTRVRVRADELNEMAKHQRSARLQLALDLLNAIDEENDDVAKKVEEVKDALDVFYGTLAKIVRGSDKEPLVPVGVLRFIDTKAEEGKETAAQRKIVAEANIAAKNAEDDDADNNDDGE